MKLLFISSSENDYLQDLTYSGLIEFLGADAVVDYPFHWQYHKPKKNIWSQSLPYPHNLGFYSQMNSSWKKQIRKALSSSNGIDSFNGVILGSAKPDAFRSIIELFKLIRLPWVFIDGGDRKEIGGDFLRTGGEFCYRQFQDFIKNYPPAFIFKRELSIGFQNQTQNLINCPILPLPFSIQSQKVLILSPNPKPNIQVQFWAVESSETRRKVFSLLKGHYDCDLNGTFAGQKFKRYRFKGQKYFEGLNQCNISLSFRGEGFDTLRYWEIPASGSLLISEQPDIDIPNNFENGKHSIFCKNDLSDLMEQIDYYLTHPQERLQIAVAGQKHLLQHHTHLKRAEFILEKIKTAL